MATPRADYDALQAEISDLRRDFATLMDGLRSKTNGIGKEAEHSIRELADHATKIYGDLGRTGRQSLTAVGRSIEERPLASILLAFALGFIGSRLLDRR